MGGRELANIIAPTTVMSMNFVPALIVASLRCRFTIVVTTEYDNGDYHYTITIHSHISSLLTTLSALPKP